MNISTRNSVCSSSIGVIQQSFGLITFVASSRPPRPTSKTDQSTFACLNTRKENKNAKLDLKAAENKFENLERKIKNATEYTPVAFYYSDLSVME